MRTAGRTCTARSPSTRRKPLLRACLSPSTLHARAPVSERTHVSQRAAGSRCSRCCSLACSSTCSFRELGHGGEAAQALAATIAKASRMPAAHRSTRAIKALPDWTGNVQWPRRPACRCHDSLGRCARALRQLPKCGTPPIRRFDSAPITARLRSDDDFRDSADGVLVARIWCAALPLVRARPPAQCPTPA